MDGVDALPHQDLAAGPNGDELACAGLQLEAGDENPRTAAPDSIHERLDGEGLDPSIEPSGVSIHNSRQRQRIEPWGQVRTRRALQTRFHTASTLSGRPTT